MIKNKKLAVITGAGRGIGRQIAIEFGKNDFNLILISRTKKELEETSRLISDKTQITVLPLDVRDNSSVQKKLVPVIKKASEVNVLINVASIQGPIGSLVDNPPLDWQKTIDINLKGTVNCMQAVIPKMIRQKFGSIINFSGGGAFSPRENFSAYAVAKAGVVRLTEVVAKEFEKYNIRVNVISPGGVNTAMFKEMIVAGENKVGQEEWAKLIQQKKSGGSGPLKAAHLCLWLVSNKSKPLTGKAFSAIHDDWQNWGKKKIVEIAKSDWYSMRRLDPYTVNDLVKK